MGWTGTALQVDVTRMTRTLTLESFLPASSSRKQGGLGCGMHRLESLSQAVDPRRWWGQTRSLVTVGLCIFWKLYCFDVSQSTLGS